MHPVAITGNLLFAVLLIQMPNVVTAANSAPGEILFDYSPYLKAPLSWPLTSIGLESNSVSIDTERFHSQPTAMLLDCTNFEGRVIVVNFELPINLVKDVREKSVVFKLNANYLQGSGKLGVTMRCFAKGEYLLGSTISYFEAEKGAWHPWELHCVIPPNEEIDSVDFHLSLLNTNDKAIVLLDDPVVQIASNAKVSPRPTQLAVLEGRSNDAPIYLVQAGQPVASIVTAANPNQIVRYAAQELNEHLRLSTGVELPVVTEEESVTGPTIHIGETALTHRLGLAPDYYAPNHWILWRADNAIILSGGDGDHDIAPPGSSRAMVPLGTLYAVYEFLERIVGVRWYWPGDIGRVVPEHKDLEIGKIKLQGAPTYEARSCFFPAHNDLDIKEEEIWKWWCRLRSGGIGGDPIGNHSFNDWPDRFEKTHPEYFALQRDGTRIFHSDSGGHVCLSNENVLKQTIADKRKVFEEYPWMRFSRVMPGDSHSIYGCQCDRCQAKLDPQEGGSGEYSNQVWGFVNQVAREVRKTHPHDFITCCAYSEYADVPDKVNLESNVAVTLCRGDLFLRLATVEHAKKSHVDFIDAWSAQTSNLYVWDYWNEPRWYKGTHGAPSIFPHAIQESFLLERGKVKGRVMELTQFDSNGVDVQQINHGRSWADWMFDSLNVYVAMQLMWNVDQDVDTMLDEFYRDFYGPAEPMLRKFYEEMETAFMNPNNKGQPEPNWDWSSVWLGTYPPEFVERVMGYLRRAEVVTRGQEPYHTRVARTLKGFMPFEINSKRYTHTQTREPSL